MKKTLLLALGLLAFAVPSYAAQLKEGLYKGVANGDSDCSVDIYNVRYHRGELDAVNAIFSWADYEGQAVVTKLRDLAPIENGVQYSRTTYKPDYEDVTYFIELNKNQTPVSFEYKFSSGGGGLTINCEKLRLAD